MALSIKSIKPMIENLEKVEGVNMISKYLKYAMLLEAEVISMAAKKIQQATEDFVKSNVDNDYEESLSNFFDGIEKTIKDFSPQIEKVTDSVNKIKDNILDFPKRKAR